MGLVLELLAKLLIIVSVLGILRSSSRFRSMSRELDEQAFQVLKRIMHATEERGYPPQLVPLLMLLTALAFMLSQYLKAAFGQ